MDQVPMIYLAGPLGFFEAGREFHAQVVVPQLQDHGYEVFDPWSVGARLYDEVVVPAIEADEGAPLEAWRRFNQSAGTANEEALRACTCVVAVLDGPDVDSGTAAEIGFAVALEKPVVGIHTDLRGSENPGAPVNLQVAHFIDRSGGSIVRSVTEALQHITSLLSP